MAQWLKPEDIEAVLQMEAKGQVDPKVMQWFRDRGEIPKGGGPTPMQKFTPPAVTPPPQPLAAMASGAANVGRFMKETVTDPETIGAMAGSLSMAKRSTPIGMAASAVGSAIPAAARELYSSVHEARKPRVTPVAEAMLSGALGEGMSRATLGVGRPKVSAAGQEAIDFYGKSKVGSHMMTDNPVLDVAGSIATHGAGGRTPMEAAAKLRSDKLYAHAESTARDLSPQKDLTGHTMTPSGIDRAAPGKAVQANLKSNLDTMKATSGFKEFLEKHGELTEKITDTATGEVKKGPSLRQLQERRSAMLNQGRQMAGTPQAAAALQEATAIRERMQALLPDDAARAEWDKISTTYRQGIEQFDNPIVQNVREATAGDKVIDKVINRQMLDYAPQIKGAAVALSNDEKVGALRKALTPEAWQQFQADTLNEVMHSAVDEKTGRLSFKQLEKLWLDPKQGLSDKTKTALFGKALPEVNKVIRLLKLEEPKTETGRLFIAIRQPSAAMATVAAAGGIGGAIAGTREGGVSGPMGAVLSGLSVVMAPVVLAKLLNSSTGRTLLVNFATATPMRQKVLVQSLIRLAAQVGTEETREEVVPRSPTSALSTEVRVPEPPRAGQ